MRDTYRHQGMRQQLIEELREKGITDEKVLSAMLQIPRHFFMDPAFIQFAYQDKAFPIGAGQTISQPYTVAFQSQLLEVKPHEKVLEVGTGSGYQSAVLIALKAQVFTIERQQELYERTKKFLPSIGYDCMFIYGDGYKGLPSFAPFDKIIVTAGAPFVPKDLLSQLKVGGRLVIPVGDGKVQQMTLIVRRSEKDFEKRVFGDFSFVPMLPHKSQ